MYVLPYWLPEVKGRKSYLLLSNMRNGAYGMHDRCKVRINRTICSTYSAVCNLTLFRLHVSSQFPSSSHRCPSNRRLIITLTMNMIHQHLVTRKCTFWLNNVSFVLNIKPDKIFNEIFCFKSLLCATASLKISNIYKTNATCFDILFYNA